MHSINIEELIETDKNNVREFTGVCEKIINCGKDTGIIAFSNMKYTHCRPFIALDTAAYLANAGARVMYIDSDFSGSELSAYYNIDRIKGFSDFLTGSVAFDEVVYMTHIPKLHMVFAGGRRTDSYKLLSGKYYKLLLKQLRKLYDYIIVDVAPIGICDDLLIAGKSCDGVIITIPSDQVSTYEVTDVRQRVEDIPLEIIGTIFLK